MKKRGQPSGTRGGARDKVERSMRIFLSHSTRDRTVGDALSALVHELFGDRVQVAYSSDQKAGGGIPPGAKWLPWIENRIREADKTYVLLTPNSISKPWVLWESGAAAGVVMARHRDSVIPVLFGISDDDIPRPFLSTQCVRGDTVEDGGIHRLLQSLNEDLGSPLTPAAFKSTTQDHVPGFLAQVKRAVQHPLVEKSLLETIPASFETAHLAGLWVTCYDFSQNGNPRKHTEICEVSSVSARCLRAVTAGPVPRSEGRKRPFRNRIEADLANRHVIGHWKNLDDSRYFGAIHLSVLTGENIMEGYYTSFSTDVAVGSGRWKWVRLDRSTMARVDLSGAVLAEPSSIATLLDKFSPDDGLLQLDTILHKDGLDADQTTREEGP